MQLQQVLAAAQSPEQLLGGGGAPNPVSGLLGAGGLEDLPKHRMNIMQVCVLVCVLVCACACLCVCVCVLVHVCEMFTRASFLHLGFHAKRLMQCNPFFMLASVKSH